MKKEYDFSKAEQGKFYSSLTKLEVGSTKRKVSGTSLIATSSGISKSCHSGLEPESRKTLASRFRGNDKKTAQTLKRKSDG